MSNVSFRKRMVAAFPVGDCSARRYAPTLRSVSIRALLSSFRLIHISDLHFSASQHTLDWRDGHLVIDTQDSPVKSQVIADFLCAPGRGPDFFGTPFVVITGDLTDSGDEADYPVALAFIERLRRSRFTVHVVPGNHDYCKEGNLIVAQVLATITPPLPPGVTQADLQTLPELALKPIKEATKAAIKAVFPQADQDGLLDYLVDQMLFCPPVTDAADNHTRRQRFIRHITQYQDYPQVLDCGSGYLILLDSMQGQMAGGDGFLAQGKLGEGQLTRLEAILQSRQAERQAGKKIAVCLHHSPFRRPDIETWTNWLVDGAGLQSIIEGRVDCVLFGHVGPSQESHEPKQDGKSYSEMPFINSENLEPMSDDYAVTLVDVEAHLRAVFQAGSGSALPPELSWLCHEVEND